MFFSFFILPLLFFFLLWILFGPLDFVINSFKEEYYFQLRKVFRISIIFDPDEIIFINVKVFFIRFNLHPLQIITNPRKNKKAEKKKKRKKKRAQRVRSLKNTGYFLSRLTWKTAETFKLKTLILDIDTGNVITNAYLIPIFTSFNKNQTQLNVNYLGQTGIHIAYENSLFLILRAVIKSNIQYKWRKLKT